MYLINIDAVSSKKVIDIFTKLECVDFVHNYMLASDDGSVPSFSIEDLKDIMTMSDMEEKQKTRLENL